MSAQRPPEFTSISAAVLRPRLPRIGNIKIGGLGQERTGKKGGTYRQPMKLDHFRITKRARDNSGNFVIDEQVHEKIGEEKPRELNVVLMFNEIAHNWQTSFVAYDGKKLRCQGNGDEAYDRGLARTIPCTCPLLRQHQGGYPQEIKRPANVVCKPYGVLSVLLPDAATYGGFYVFRTTSYEMISSITASLQLFYQQFGGLAFLPLRMVLNPVLDTYEEGGQTKTSTTWKVSLVLAGSIDTAIQIASGAHGHRERIKLLSSGQQVYSPEEHAEQLREIAREDDDEVRQEYYPETTDGAVTQDAEFEIEEDDVSSELDEEVCRLALEYSDWEQIRINRQVAKYSDDLKQLTAILDAQMPSAMVKAREEIERKYGGGEPVAEDSSSGAAEQEDLF